MRTSCDMKSTPSCIKWLANLALESALDACGKVEETRDTKVHLLLNKLNTAAKDAAATEKQLPMSRVLVGSLTWEALPGEPCREPCLGTLFEV